MLITSNLLIKFFFCLLIGCLSGLFLMGCESPTAPTTQPDQNGVLRINYKPDPANSKINDQKDLMDSEMAILSKRMSILNIKNSKISLINGDQIMIEISGLKDPREIEIKQELTSRTAIIEFGEMADEKDPRSKWTIAGQNWKPALATLNKEQVALTSSYFKNNSQVITKSSTRLIFELTDEGGTLSKQITIRLLNKPLGVFSGDNLISYPVVVAVITNIGIIEGLSESEAIIVKDLINEGSLPVPLKLMDSHFEPAP